MNPVWLKFVKIFLSLMMAAVFLFNSLSFATPYNHHETSCSSHQEVMDSGGHAHAKDCQDLPGGHQHGKKESGAPCGFGHCHSGHGSVLFSGARISPRAMPSSSLEFSPPGSGVYLNPYLGKPLQPPRT